MQKPSPVSSIILFICGAILLYCAFGTGWFSLGEDGGAGLGRVSFDGHSEWFISSKHLRIEELLGTVAMLFTFAAAVMSVIAGALLLKPGKTVLALLAVIAMGAAMLFAIAFTAKVKEHELSFGGGFYLFWLCSIGVIVAGILAMTRTAAAQMGYPGQMPMPQQGYPQQGYPQQGYPQQPQQPYANVPMGGPVAAAPIGMPCNVCGTATVFVAQYNKQFCQRCNRYL